MSDEDDARWRALESHGLVGRSAKPGVSAQVPFENLDPHHRRVALGLVTLLALGAEEFPATTRDLLRDIDNLVPGGLHIGAEDTWPRVLHEWLKVLLEDHQR